MAWAARYATQGGSHAAAIAIAFAMAQLGKPYQWRGLPGAYDCSGLVYAAYAAAGMHIARTTYQWQQDGPCDPRSRSSLATCGSARAATARWLALKLHWASWRNSRRQGLRWRPW